MHAQRLMLFRFTFVFYAKPTSYTGSLYDKPTPCPFQSRIFYMSKYEL